VGDWVQPDLHADGSAMALTEVVTADASALVAATTQREHEFKGLVALLRLMAALETALLHNHIVRLGRQTAYERMAHLMLEFHARLHVAGLAVGHEFAMPLTQETLADSLGVSVVHVSRILMQLRRDGLLQTASGKVRILDLSSMQAVADWVPIAIGAKLPRHAALPAR
jgi:CRP-like cAMP-binding protein